jgi:hypothetical protein
VAGSSDTSGSGITMCIGTGSSDAAGQGQGQVQGWYRGPGWRKAPDLLTTVAFSEVHHVRLVTFELMTHYKSLYSLIA